MQLPGPGRSKQPLGGQCCLSVTVAENHFHMPGGLRASQKSHVKPHVCICVCSFRGAGSAPSATRGRGDALHLQVSTGARHGGTAGLPRRRTTAGRPGCHGNCILLGLGVERVGSRGEEMVTLDSGLCLSPCFCISSPHPCPTPATTSALAPRFLVNVPPQHFPPLVLCLHLVSLSLPSLSLHLFLALHPSSSHSCLLWAGYHSVPS